MGSRSPKRKGALQQAKEYLRINPTASNAKVVEDLNISVRTVCAARAFLVQTGVIPRSYFDRTSGRKDLTDSLADATSGPIEGALPTTGVAELEKLAKQVEADLGEPMTPEEQRKRLSAVVRHASNAGNFQLEIAAIQALARLDERIGAKDRLGPGPPLTDEDKVHRLGLLIEACGKRITRKALERAFNGSFTTKDQAESSQDAGGLGGSTEIGLVEEPNGVAGDVSEGRGEEEGSG